MTTKAHKNLTGADLHEPKGIATATASQVYRADGSGSGSWQTITIPTGLFRMTFSQFTASGTWTKPSGLIGVRVHVIGSGQAGGTGGTASFGAYCSATGGSTLAGGAGSGGDVNLTAITPIVTSSSDSISIGFGAGPFVGKGITLSGYGGGYALKWLSTGSLSATVAVTVGTAGANNGYVLVEEFISV